MPFFVSLWLRNNEPEAAKKHSASVPRREELNRLKKELCDKFDLPDIRYTTFTYQNDKGRNAETVYTC